MGIVKKLIRIGWEIAKDYGSTKELQSKNWGFLHGTSVKLLKSTLRKTNDIPISVFQTLSTSCKHFPWPGLRIERTTIPNSFREQSYQFLKKYFEDKYGQYPVPIRYHWNKSEPLNIQWLTPKNRTMEAEPPTLYHIHGGAWALLHSCVHNHIFRDLTEASNSQVMSIEYRLLPQYPLLSLVEDVFAGYFYLLAPISEGGAGIKNSKIVAGGESAGAHLTTILLHILRNAGLPNPKGAYLISPAVDTTFSQPSIFTNNKSDYFWEFEEPPKLDRNGLHLKSNINNMIYYQAPAQAQERISKDGTPFGPKEILLWPEISPLFDTDMSKLPPTIIVVGERDSLRDFGVLYGKLRAEAEIKSRNRTTIIPNIQTYNFEDMVHAFPSLPSNKYCKKAIKTMGEFIYQALNSNDQKALDSKKYVYLPDYKKAYKESNYNMYWNNLENVYSPWNSTYPILPFPKSDIFSIPSNSLPPYREKPN